MKCSYCKKEFEDHLIELSHDIPKYLGGTDFDGRHYLCHKHHKEYDLKILLACLKYLGENLECELDIISWQKELKIQPEPLKIKFRAIAEEVRRNFYGT